VLSHIPPQRNAVFSGDSLPMGRGDAKSCGDPAAGVLQ